MISDLLCAVRGVKGAHRFTFFAHEVDMLITWMFSRKTGGPGSWLANCQTNLAPSASLDNWLQWIGLYVFVLVEATCSDKHDEEQQAPPPSFTTSYLRSDLRSDRSGLRSSL